MRQLEADPLLPFPVPPCLCVHDKCNPLNDN
jgi:hypothetical protein